MVFLLNKLAPIITKKGKVNMVKVKVKDFRSILLPKTKNLGRPFPPVNHYIVKIANQIAKKKGRDIMKRLLYTHMQWVTWCLHAK